MPVGFDPKTVVARELEKKGLRRVCVIDDVFDPPNAEKLQAEIKVFFRLISEDEELNLELENCGLFIKEEQDINNDVLSRLLNLEDCSRALNAARQSLFSDNQTKRNELSAFCDSLRHELKLSVESFGSKHDVAVEESYDIVFLDYDLADGPDDSGAQAKEIYKTHKAFIFLMSDKFDGEEVKSLFRVKYKLLRGFFQFVPKTELFDIDRFCPRLASVPTDVPVREAIHNFVDTLEDRLNLVKDQMVQTVRDLGLVDYAYLEQLSLNAEDHPLGDYMLRLFSEYLQSKLYEDESMFQAARRLDELEYLEYLPVTEAPSSALARIYTAYLTHQLHAEDFAPHAKLGAETLPWLQLGDIIVKDIESPIFAVVNAPCDLQFGPTRATRDADDSVLLLPGRLRRLDDCAATPRKPFKTTALYEFNGEAYRIEWDYLKVITVPHCEIRDRFQKTGYTHKRRFRIGPAFELQTAFVRMIGRLGIEVQPPINRPTAINVYSRGIEDKPVLLGTVRGGAVTFHRRAEDNDVFALTALGRESLAKLLEKHQGSLSRAIESNPVTEENRKLIGELTRFADGLPLQAKKYSVICPFFRETNSIPIGNTTVTKERIRVTSLVDRESPWDASTWAIIEILKDEGEQQITMEGGADDVAI